MMGGRIAKIKKMLVILAAAMMAVAVVECGVSTQGGSDTGKEAGKETEKEIEKETEKETEKGKAGDAAELQGKSIFLMTPYLGLVITNQMVEYIEQKLTDAGAETSVINTNNDFSQLASRPEDVISAGTDGIMSVSVGPGQLSNQLRDVLESEIPVFGCDSGFIERMQVNAISDNYQMGELIVKYLLDDLMGGKGTVITLTHKPHPGVVECYRAFDDLIKEYPGVILITEQHVPTEQSISNAQDIVEDLLLANPDPGSITVIRTAWDEPVTGATQVLQETGRSQVLVTGVDGNRQTISLVKEGANLKATVKQSFEGMAQIVYEQMDQYFKGKEIGKGEMYTPATLITQENADAQ